MKTGAIAGIIIAIVVVAIIAIVAGSLVSVRSQNNEFCGNWLLQVEQAKTDLSNQWIQTDGELATLNAQIDAYNVECA